MKRRLYSFIFFLILMISIVLAKHFLQQKLEQNIDKNITEKNSTITNEIPTKLQSTTENSSENNNNTPKNINRYLTDLWIPENEKEKEFLTTIQATCYKTNRSPVYCRKFDLKKFISYYNNIKTLGKRTSDDNRVKNLKEKNDLIVNDKLIESGERIHELVRYNYSSNLTVYIYDFQNRYTGVHGYVAAFFQNDGGELTRFPYEVEDTVAKLYDNNSPEVLEDKIHLIYVGYHTLDPETRKNIGEIPIKTFNLITGERKTLMTLLKDSTEISPFMISPNGEKVAFVIMKSPSPSKLFVLEIDENGELVSKNSYHIKVVASGEDWDGNFVYIQNSDLHWLDDSTMEYVTFTDEAELNKIHYEGKVGAKKQIKVD